ncbi:MAG: hypothetical protein GF320_05880 [Armatimonadia bacterium]|nr:hypothetical protein [Armatimonadia bacterium]
MRNAQLAIPILALLVLAAQVAPAQAQDAWDLTELQAIEIWDAPTAPLVDGDLDEMAWRDARQYGIQGTEAILPELKVMLTHHEGILYAGFEMREPDDGLVADAGDRDDEKVLTDDSVELILDPDLTLRDGMRIAVNSRGVLYDALLAHGGSHEAPAKDYELEVGVQTRGRVWSTEIAIPFDEMGMAGEFGEVLGVNAALRKAGGGRTCLSVTEGECDLAGISIAGIGLEALDEDQVRIDLYDASVSGGELTFDMAARNKLHQSEHFDFTIRVLSPHNPWVKSSFFMMIDDHETARFERGPFELGEGGACLVMIEVVKRNRERAKENLGIVAYAGRPAE